MTTTTQKLPLFALTAMVVGSMVGAGIFNLPGRSRRRPGRSAPSSPGPSPAPACTCWPACSSRWPRSKPDIDSGVFAYAKAGFGDYMGFLSAFGYWLGSCLGNVFYWVLIGSTLGRFFPDLRRRQHGDRDHRVARSASGRSIS